MGKKTKVVLDTNIWVSIFFNKTLGKEFDDLFNSGEIEVFVSEEILREIARVLEYPKIKTVLEKAGISSKEVLREISGLSKVVNPKRKLKIIREDPEDNKFLECALECGAEYIVSGDKHLLRAGEFEGIKIIPAREFIERMR
ncbi:putative toxin-antitoxin system toxin component, PIN family [Geoglobus ahangari]|uniref:Putative toxin-antitoxin system toxin component, PIN family n=1 Tax=Geoglobus ahangari TaxID=113653 RepID=A0A0F7DBB2_9EURY|nr:putative toxin-antitoxin system toxin component, PIN family [Geoglobus ahangari]AKG90786.1 putative toxin-antitoxin system toxin component, PIN family [Geoglobus ahangari]